MIIIYTDGACKKNPGAGGWGYLVIQGDRFFEMGGAEKDTTNNRMEMTAAVEALRKVADIQGNKEIYTDSQYLRQGITSWIKNWKRNGWRTSGKEDVKNKDLWVELDRLNDSSITWKWVKGHARNKYNNRVDSIADCMARGEDPGLRDSNFADFDNDSEENADSSSTTKKAKKTCATVIPVCIPSMTHLVDSLKEKFKLSITGNPSREEMISRLGIKDRQEYTSEKDCSFSTRWEDLGGRSASGKIFNSFNQAIELKKPGTYVEILHDENAEAPCGMDIEIRGLLLEARRNGSFLVAGDDGKEVEKTVDYIFREDGRLFKNLITLPPLAFPTDLKEWRHIHLHEFLRPFFKKIVGKWEYDLGEKKVVISKPGDSSDSFGINISGEYSWETLPPRQYWDEIRLAASRTSTFPDRYVGVSLETPAGAVCLLFLLGSGSLKLSMFYKADALYSLLYEKDEARRKAVIDRFSQHLEGLGRDFFTMPKSGENKFDSLEDYRNDADSFMFGKQVEFFRRIPQAPKNVPIDLIFELKPYGEERFKRLRDVLDGKSEGKIRVRKPDNMIERRALGLGEFMAMELLNERFPGK